MSSSLLSCQGECGCGTAAFIVRIVRPRVPLDGDADTRHNRSTRMTHTRALIVSCVLGAIVSSGAMAARLDAGAAPLPESLFSGLSWRQIGPFRGGRISAVTGVPSAPETYYL